MIESSNPISMAKRVQAPECSGSYAIKAAESSA